MPFDAHYSDQAQTYVTGGYVPQHYEESEVAANTNGTLKLVPAK